MLVLCVLFVLLSIQIAPVESQVRPQPNFNKNDSCVGPIPTEQYYFLFDLFNSTNGENWIWDSRAKESTIWYFPSNISDPCTQQWQGVNCSIAINNSSSCEITSIILANRNLEGTLPISIGNVSTLSHMFFNNNLLSGTLPITLSMLSNIKTMFLYNNKFTGTIESSLFTLTNVEILEIYENQLTGTIPTSIGNMRKAQVMGLVQNYLTGTIPNEMNSMESLMYVYLYSNFLSGTIPYLASLRNVTYFGIQTNLLTGTLPSELGLISAITQFCVSDNSLISSIPSELAYLVKVQNMELRNNYFTGTIPTQFGELVELFNLELNYNYLTGILPRELSRCLLGSVEISHNYLTGTIPAAYGLVFRLESIDVGYNYLSGSLPDEYGYCLFFKSILFNSNYVSGTIPSTWTALPVFQMINGSSNLLSGNLSSLFPDNNRSSFMFSWSNRTWLSKLRSVSLSSNELTGTIPISLFSSTALNTVVLYSNCFSGSLGEAICRASKLTTLILDSLDGASTCEVRFPKSLQPIFKGFFSGSRFSGTIPQCVWTMRSLTTLHLSSNGLHGTIGSIDVDTSALQDVTLASNNLVGSLPLSFQQYGKFTQLDVSFNRLMGELNPSFAINESNKILDLTVNRFSGKIPMDLMRLSSLNILEGNLFQCQNDNKPTDPNAKQYQCGSSNLNYSLLIWLCCFGFVGAIAVLLLAVDGRRVCCALGNIARQIRVELLYFQSGVLSGNLNNTFQFASITTRFYTCALILTALFLLLALVAFLLLKLVPSLAVLYSTHSVQFTWITTAAYLHGVAPVVVIVCILYASILLLRQLLGPIGTYGVDFNLPTAPVGARAKENIDNEVSTGFQMQPAQAGQKMPMDESTDSSVLTSASSISSSSASRLKSLSLSIALQLVNMAVTLVVNIAYVYAIFQGLSFWSLAIVQLLLGVYKLVWVNGVMSLLLRKLAFLSHAQKLQHRAFMAMFTFIAGPFLATFFSDSTCFRYLVTGPPTISSSFETDLFGCEVNCITYLGCFTVCAFTDKNVVTVDTVVVPGWLYSYQCFSALLSNYVPVLVLSFLFSGVVFPVALLAYVHLSPERVEQLIPEFVREAILADTIHMHVHRGSGEHHSGYDMQQYLDRVSLHRATLSQFPSRERGRSLFNSDIIVTKLLLNVTMLLTFGLSSPLFAIMVCVDAFSTNFLWRILIGRYLKLWTNSNNCNEPIDKENSSKDIWDDSTDDLSSIQMAKLIPEEARKRLERATHDAHKGIIVSLYWVVLFAGTFWSLAVFDMIGDVNGALVGGLSTMAVWLALPILYWAVGKLQMGMSLTMSSSEHSESVSQITPWKDSLRDSWVQSPTMSTLHAAAADNATTDSISESPYRSRSCNASTTSLTSASAIRVSSVSLLSHPHNQKHDVESLNDSL